MTKPKKKSNSSAKSAKINSALPVTRKLKHPQYKSFKLSKRIKHPGRPVSSGFKLFWRGLKHLWQHKKVFLIISVIYIILTLLLVKSLSLGPDAASTKALWQNLFSAGNNNLASGFTFFGYLLGTASKTSSDVASLYQTMLVVIMSLVFIWTLRQTHADKNPKVKEAFYKSQYPLVQFILVAGAMIIQLIPLLIASVLYSYVFGNALAVTVAEKGLWLALFFAMSLLSLYMITSSVFALYIVTLPDVEPFQALRSARELVRYRRWTIMRKVLFLPLALIATMLVIGLPVIIFLTPLAEWWFFIMGMFGLLIVHSYLYGLYRELL